MKLGFVEKGETKRIEFTLNKAVFPNWNVDINEWNIEKGDFKILIGSSSEQINISNIISIK